MSRKSWIWPVGLAVAGLASVATILLRGCWHNRMSWPTKDEKSQEFSYQVCTNCGVKRLFDEQTFQAYGPYSYDLHELIVKERLWRMNRAHKAAVDMEKATIAANKQAKHRS